jgi:hypothetical protein
VQVPSLDELRSPSDISSLLCYQTGLVLSCRFEEGLLIEERCENLRSEFSKIPRLRAQVEMILKGMSLA